MQPQPVAPTVECTSDILKNSWQATLKIDRQNLAIETNLDASSHANVCFIIGEKEKRQFLTVGDLGWWETGLP